MATLFRLRKTLGVLLLTVSTLVVALDIPVYDFPLDAYPQDPNLYFPTTREDYTTNLLTPQYQAQQLQNFYKHYYDTSVEGRSPWSEALVSELLPTVNAEETQILAQFDNRNKSFANKHYAANFKEHDYRWWSDIAANMSLEQCNTNVFDPKHRAIAVTNTLARALPDAAPDFLHSSLPGQGFPFDNLQQSAIWAGTPLYVIGTSADKAWSLVVTPEAYFDWVKSTDIAYVTTQFIAQWQQAASQGLIAVTATQTPIVDCNHHFALTGYIGALFPKVASGAQYTQILIPLKNADNQAMLKKAQIATVSAAEMPWSASPQHVMDIIAQLQNRPYGWGGAFFFNDCSQEMKSIFTPFGIWLPRNSAQQGQLGGSIDLSSLTPDARIKTLQTLGHPLMTLIYIGGHIMLYLGSVPTQDASVPMTYQNIWGLSSLKHDKRYVIGQSVFFPLLNTYPDYPDVLSLAGRAVFKIVNLDGLPNKKVNA